MAWTYWNWIVCNILIGLGIIIITYTVIFILLLRFEQVFYSMIAKLFNIKRCIIDIHNNPVRKNNGIFNPKMKLRNISNHFITKLCRCCGKVRDETSELSEEANTLANNNFFSTLCGCMGETILKNEEEIITAAETKIQNNKVMKTALTIANSARNEALQYRANHDETDQETGSVDDPESKSNTGTTYQTPVTNFDESTVPSQSTDSEEKSSKTEPWDPEYEREVLQMYGRYLSLNKKRNKFLMVTISTTVISAVLLAAVEGCFLAITTIYQDSACPDVGIMDCFHGANQTYFQCIPGNTINFTLLSTSAMCFRWIGRDTSISAITTQIGICAGLVTAFGSVVECLLRLLIFVFQLRRGVASGMRRLMEKTIGINRVTQPCHCCGRMLGCHFGILNPCMYEHPWLVILFCFIYVCLPAIFIASVILLTYFRISITALTYIILFTVVLICCLALIWVLWEEDEMGKILPGGSMHIQQILNSETARKFLPLVDGVLPKEIQQNMRDGVEKVTDKVKNVIKKSGAEQYTRYAEDLYQKMQVPKTLTGSAHEVRSKVETEKSKDMKNILLKTVNKKINDV